MKGTFREHVFELLYVCFLANFLRRAFSFTFRRETGRGMSTIIRLERVILYASFMYARARAYIYTREYVNEDARTSVRIHKDRLLLVNLAVKS